MNAHTRALMLGTAVGALALCVSQLRPLRRHVSALPGSYLEVLRRHVGAEDARELEQAARAHVSAGKPLTRAALGALASMYLSPAQVRSVSEELQQLGKL